MGSLTRLTAPAAEPVTTAEGKAHMRVDLTDDDTLIAALLVAARDWVENYTGRKLVSQQWRWNLDAFPECSEMLLPLAPVVSVDEIAYTAPDSTVTVFDASSYLADVAGEPGRVVLKDGVSWPAFGSELAVAAAVSVKFTVGYANAAAVPERFKLAIKMLAAHFYENRENTVPMELRQVPLGVQALLADFSAWNYFHHARLHPEAS